MSQYNTRGTGGSPTVPTSFTTDFGVAVPVANNLNVFAEDSPNDNDNGIFTVGIGDTLTIALSNRVTGTVTTTDATPTTIISISLGATPNVFYIEGNVVAFDTTDSQGGVYNFVSGMRTDGVNAIEIATEFKDEFEEASMAPSTINVQVSGNNMVLVVTGIAATTIRWNALLTYRSAG